MPECQSSSCCSQKVCCTQPKRKVCLIVIDGWGISDEQKGNAIFTAETPCMDKLGENCLKLEASETHVGVPDGQMGNSEVGHLNIGAGRIVFQDLVRINSDITNNRLASNEGIIEACTRAKTVSDGRIHLFGLVSDGGVHSHIAHMEGIVKACKAQGVKKLFLHFISDGRDTSPTSGVTFMQQVLDFFKGLEYGELSTVVGRYYAMDRDKNWERTKVAFDAFVYSVGEQCPPDQLIERVKKSYALGGKDTDEFLKPLIVGGSESRVRDNDTLVLFNYRADRMRQIATCFGLEPKFDSKLPSNLKLFCMTQYDSTFPFSLLFAPISMKNVLAEHLAACKVPQLHVAETEKYAHVTFFFNGGAEKQFELEDRILVPSPKVATYDLKPEMSAHEVATKVIEGIESAKYPFIMLNFAPPDMVGHTGMFDAAVLACAYTDKEIQRIYDACEKHDYVCMITADHGNAEKMIDENGKPHTAHTLFPVPLIATRNICLCPPADRNPALCDVAPTILDIMGLPIPSEMTGKSLYCEKK